MRVADKQKRCVSTGAADSAVVKTHLCLWSTTATEGMSEVIDA